MKINLSVSGRGIPLERRPMDKRKKDILEKICYVNERNGTAHCTLKEGVLRDEVLRQMQLFIQASGQLTPPLNPESILEHRSFSII
ncbi:MAG TPA: hypothetical protein P5048_00295 [Chlamydiales bacterium]|nr:hypothetical protein [Chlamydiales bacterium]